MSTPAHSWRYNAELLDRWTFCLHEWRAVCCVYIEEYVTSLTDSEQLNTSHLFLGTNWIGDSGFNYFYSVLFYLPTTLEQSIWCISCMCVLAALCSESGSINTPRRFLLLVVVDYGSSECWYFNGTKHEHQTRKGSHTLRVKPNHQRAAIRWSQVPEIVWHFLHSAVVHIWVLLIQRLVT